MYSPAVIAAKIAKLESRVGAVLPGGRLQPIPAPECHAMVRTLEGIFDHGKKVPIRAFTPDEQHFVANERLMCPLDFSYFAQRYWMIQSEGQTLKPLFPLWESQTLILAELARQEELRWRSRHPDGLLCNGLKGRQLGYSTLAEALIGHRVVTQTYVKGLVASDVPANSGSQGIFGMLELGFSHLPWWLKPGVKFWNTDSHLVLANGSSVIVESGKSMKGGLQEEGGQKGQLGRSKTYSVGHLTELSTWEYAETIDDALMPAIPQTPRTLFLKESTAKGRHNWWHEEWLATEAGLTRSFNVFIPWYAERSKYWLPVPDGWVPSDETLAFAARVQSKGPQYMRRAVSLSKEQLYWYELRRAEAVHKGHLYKFLEEYPAEPEEAFQYSGRSIFSIETMDRLERQAKPLADLWQVAPHGELRDDREALLRELAAEQQVDRERLAAERLRRAERVNEDSRPQTLVIDSPDVADA